LFGISRAELYWGVRGFLGLAIFVFNYRILRSFSAPQRNAEMAAKWKLADHEICG
jgi:hypothetical protein